MIYTAPILQYNVSDLVRLVKDIMSFHVNLAEKPLAGILICVYMEAIKTVLSALSVHSRMVCKVLQLCALKITFY